MKTRKTSARSSTRTSKPSSRTSSRRSRSSRRASKKGWAAKIAKASSNTKRSRKFCSPTFHSSTPSPFTFPKWPTATTSIKPTTPPIKSRTPSTPSSNKSSRMTKRPSSIKKTTSYRSNSCSITAQIKTLSASNFQTSLFKKSSSWTCPLRIQHIQITSQLWLLTTVNNATSKRLYSLGNNI